MPWWLVPSSPTSPARSTAITHRLVVLADVVDDLVEGPLEERRVQRDDRPLAAHRQAGRHRHRVLLGDPDVEEAIRELGLELVQAGAGRHAGGDRRRSAGRRGRSRSARPRRRRCSSAASAARRPAGRRRGVVGHRLGRHAADACGRAELASGPAPGAVAVAVGVRLDAAVIGGSAAPWKPTWSVSAGR